MEGTPEDGQKRLLSSGTGWDLSLVTGPPSCFQRLCYKRRWNNLGLQPQVWLKRRSLSSLQSHSFGLVGTVPPVNRLLGLIPQQASLE